MTIQILQRTKRSVYKWVTRFRNEGYAGLKVRNRSGRPRETDEACDQRMIAAAILSPFDTAEEIRETAEAVNIAIRNVRSRLLEAGLKARTPSVKNFLKEMHRANRIKFATEHIHYNLDFW
uniref:Transposase Tc1-like domain-containing protein n=1 Tax=Daphnia galeata TaxID=27404 RepID=A0A8J2RIG5_9CRUS|nr:unnamed protein product [Daphnia galeata]